MKTSPEHTAVALIRVWREHGAFRATISSMPDVTSARENELVGAASEEELLRLVAEWLRSL